MNSTFIQSIQSALSTHDRVFIENVTESQLSEILANKDTLNIPIAVFKKDTNNGNSARVVKQSKRTLALSLKGAHKAPFLSQRNFVKLET